MAHFFAFVLLERLPNNFRDSIIPKTREELRKSIVLMSEISKLSTLGTCGKADELLGKSVVELGLEMGNETEFCEELTFGEKGKQVALGSLEALLGELGDGVSVGWCKGNGAVSENFIATELSAPVIVINPFE